MNKTWIAAIAVTLVVTFASAAIAEVVTDEPVVPKLVEVPCDPDQFLDKSELETTVCYREVGRLTRQEQATLRCNADLSPAQEEEARAKPVCEGVEDIPEDDEDEIIVPLEAE
jgi:hypothetical protein